MASTDDFWEESEVRGYNFDDDEPNGNQMCGFSLGGAARLSQQIKKGINSENDGLNFDTFSVSPKDANKASIQPDLMDLISEKALNAILGADSGDFQAIKVPLKPEEELRFLRRQVENRWSPPDVKSVLKKCLLGQPYTLELYKSIESKKELLKEAVALGDGDSILLVVLFLSRTLKKSLFQQLLSNHPVAVNHYVNYLNIRMLTQEMTDILEMVMRGQEAAMKQFSVACQNPQKRLQRLKICSRNHFGDSEDKVFVENYIKLLEWQQEIGASELVGESVLNCLAYTCENHWNDSKGVPTSPYTLSQLHAISDRQFQWVALNGLAKHSLWSDVETLFVSKGWLGGKKLKAILPMDQVVIQLHKMNAPSDVLRSYMELIDDIEKRLAIAKKLQCHKVIIDIYTAQRDRKALLCYKTNLHPQSEDYFYAEHIIRSSNTKWKN